MSASRIDHDAGGIDAKDESLKRHTESNQDTTRRRSRSRSRGQNRIRSRSRDRGRSRSRTRSRDRRDRGRDRDRSRRGRSRSRSRSRSISRGRSRSRIRSRSRSRSRDRKSRYRDRERGRDRERDRYRDRDRDRDRHREREYRDKDGKYSSQRRSRSPSRSQQSAPAKATPPSNPTTGSSSRVSLSLLQNLGLGKSLSVSNPPPPKAPPSESAPNAATTTGTNRALEAIASRPVEELQASSQLTDDRTPSTPVSNTLSAPATPEAMLDMQQSRGSTAAMPAVMKASHPDGQAPGSTQAGKDFNARQLELASALESMGRGRTVAPDSPLSDSSQISGTVDMHRSQNITPTELDVEDSLADPDLTETDDEDGFPILRKRLLPGETKTAEGGAERSVHDAMTDPTVRHMNPDADSDARAIEEFNELAHAIEQSRTMQLRLSWDLRKRRHDCRPVGEYTWLNRIDEGTFGAVHRARCQRTGEIRALKQIKLNTESSSVSALTAGPEQGFPTSSLREIFALQSLRHPNILRIVDVVTKFGSGRYSTVSRPLGPMEDHVYIVMEYLEHDLSTVLAALKQPLTLREIKCLLKQLLEGVSELHSHNFVHRDLKTSNLLLNDEGILKIADLGSARLGSQRHRYLRGSGYGKVSSSSASENAINPRYTTPVVTLWYRPPELFFGAVSHTTAIDMWSVGCIFAELILGKPLFSAEGELAMISAIFNLCGHPTMATWSGFFELPQAALWRPSKQQQQQPSAQVDSSDPLATVRANIRKMFPSHSYTGAGYLTEVGVDLLAKMLSINPETRISASEALSHPFFSELPLPGAPSALPLPRSANSDTAYRSRIKGSKTIGGEIRDLEALIG